jgi:hypothetical protein
MKEEYKHQDGHIIKTVRPSNVAHAIIFDNEQRKTIYRLMSHGFLPHHTSIGKGLSTKRHWQLQKYRGRFGRGFKMITTSPYSSNFNHLTYFLTA